MWGDGFVVIYLIGWMILLGIMGLFFCKYIFFGGYVLVLLEVFVLIEWFGLWVCDIEILWLYYYYMLCDWWEWFM